ncbi:phenol-soluble modulin export ABC transporter permease subunit PmtB [Staphylococcus caprae]|uniref:phenol-soluble modulin export ABC transporter permease subunit PmtB n=1 Tax=Staphylococcus caprae TaxID=29380 RepID=UPI001BD10089|nr:ABC-2 transporter permease [Staphylococcus caprae]
MKQLLIRNIKLRRWTLLIYGLLLLFFPVYHLIDKHHLVFSVISGPMGVILTIICLVDAGHLFRINRRLGGSQSYLFFGSLPVSKKDLLNANYISCIVLTLIGALIISLYGYETNTIKTDSISFSTTYSFIIANFFSIPIAFRKSTEQKNKDVPYIGYVFGIMIVLPIILSAIFILINYITRNDSHIPTIYSYFLNYGLLMISIICLIINYVIQIKKFKN